MAKAGDVVDVDSRGRTYVQDAKTFAGGKVFL
jgi:hypothetical protein